MPKPEPVEDGELAELAEGDKIIPKGANKKLSPKPKVKITEDDVKEAQTLWDETFPDYKELLDAEVTG